MAYVSYIDGIGYLCRSTRDGFLILAEVPSIEALVEKARSKAAVQVRS